MIHQVSFHHSLVLSSFCKYVSFTSILGPFYLYTHTHTHTHTHTSTRGLFCQTRSLLMIHCVSFSMVCTYLLAFEFARKTLLRTAAHHELVVCLCCLSQGTQAHTHTYTHTQQRTTSVPQFCTKKKIQVYLLNKVTLSVDFYQINFSQYIFHEIVSTTKNLLRKVTAQ